MTSKKRKAAGSAAATIPAAATGQDVVRIDVADKDIAHTIAGFLHELGEPLPDAVTLFEEGKGWRVEAYYAASPTAAALGQMLESALGRPAPKIAIVPVPAANWVAISQAALPPVRIGRFVIHGSHDRARIGRGPHAIEIEAGEAFGTAHHATTQGCLAAIDRLARCSRGGHMLDLGCGSGVLAIAAFRTLPGARILASDIDQRSAEVAGENVRLNGAAARVRVIAAAGFEHAALRRRRFDIIVANILAGPLIRLANQVARATARGGTVVLSGLLHTQAREVLAHYRAAGFALVRHETTAGWSTLTLKAMGRTAMRRTKGQPSAAPQP